MLSTWETDEVAVEDPEHHDNMRALRSQGPKIRPWIVPSNRGYRVGDVFVLMEIDQNEAVQVWPPMRVLRLGRPVAGEQVIYLRDSSLLQPLPPDRLESIRPQPKWDSWLRPTQARQVLSLWDLPQGADNSDG